MAHKKSTMHKLILPGDLCKETEISISRSTYLPSILISAVLHFWSQTKTLSAFNSAVTFKSNMSSSEVLLDTEK